ncbi:hypothetical protein [Actinoplanes sp. TFC3]|uniref:hypothetical protein n=1 Tax=Actinoplanes sp. TFC3 TaxID=1710355 RepID=UPI00082F856B|nr:hypothetical protein [Actinoplanes sp. TFC3]
MTLGRAGAALLAGVTLAVAGCAPTGPAGAPAWHTAAPAPSVPASKAPEAGKKPRIQSGNGVKGPLGEVIDLGGLKDGTGDRYVIYAVTGGAVNDTSDFGFAIGVRRPGNVVTEDLTISEYQGTATTPGFHPMQAQMDLGAKSVQPAFGYYSGTPASITVRDTGRTLTAHLARWSEDPGTTVFWFDPADVHDSSQWSDLGAYDASGARLPDGHIELSTF